MTEKIHTECTFYYLNRTCTSCVVAVLSPCLQHTDTVLYVLDSFIRITCSSCMQDVLFGCWVCEAGGWQKKGEGAGCIQQLRPRGGVGTVYGGCGRMPDKLQITGMWLFCSSPPRLSSSTSLIVIEGCCLFRYLRGM